MNEQLLFLHHYIPCTTTEGPGKRFVIWLQGCSIRCKGCMLPHTWKRKEGKRMAVDDLFCEIMKSITTEGVTILGGEPLDQPTALLALLKKIKQTEKTILLFTGYEMEKLSDPEQQEIVSLCDIVVDGPYREESQDFSRPMIGSANQCIHFNTNRYSEADWQQIPRQLEVRIDNNGEVLINGMWKRQWMEDFLENC